MNCPICAEFNVYSEIVMLPGVYMCKNEMCNFCEDIESFEISNEYATCEIPENYVSTTEFLYSENDIFKDQEFHENSNELISLLSTNSNIDITTLEFENTCNGSNFETCSLENSNETICTNNTILKSPKFDIFNTYNDSKSEMVSKILSANNLINLKHFKNKIFNCLRMPNSFNTECKIIRILLLYLDIFKIYDDHRLNEIKYEYTGIEIFGNNLSKDKIKPLCYNLMEKLYHITENNVENSAENVGCEGVLGILSSLFDKNDLSNKLKLKYISKDSCSSCGFINKLKSSDYFLRMERFIKIKENKFIGKSFCLKCNSRSRKRISLKRVPEFLVFYCPDGLENDYVNLYENPIRTDDNRQLFPVAVVEFGSAASEAKKDCLVTRELYEISNKSVDSRPSSNYCVHFRNKNGWFSINDLAPILVKPSPHLSTNNNKDVRLLIFGTISDPNIIYETFSLKAFIETNKAYLSREVLANCKSSELKNYCNDLVDDLNSKQIKSRKVSKRTKKMIKRNNRTVESVGLERNDDNFTDFSQQSFNKPTEDINSPIDQLLINYSSNTNVPSSSGVSSSSSLFDTENFPNELVPTDPFRISATLNNPARLIELQRKRPFNLIDDLISMQCQKLKKKRKN